MEWYGEDSLGAVGGVDLKDQRSTSTYLVSLLGSFFLNQIISCYTHWESVILIFVLDFFVAVAGRHVFVLLHLYVRQIQLNPSLALRAIIIYYSRVSSS